MWLYACLTLVRLAAKEAAHRQRKEATRRLEERLVLEMAHPVDLDLSAKPTTRR